MPKISPEEHQRRIDAIVKYKSGYVSITALSKEVKMKPGSILAWMYLHEKEIPAITNYNPDSIECHTCGQHFINNHAFSTHYKILHKEQCNNFCEKCGQTLTDYNKSETHKTICIFCLLLIDKPWFDQSNIKRANSQRRRFAFRLRCIEHYGGKCACCNESTYEFLAVDHINGGGRKHSKEINGNLSKWVVTHNFPKEFQILCHNCNSAKGSYGKCPHQNKNESNN
jgi:hypothetical protein